MLKNSRPDVNFKCIFVFLKHEIFIFCFLHNSQREKGLGLGDVLD